MFPEKRKKKKIERSARMEKRFFRYLDTILRSTLYSYRASEVRDPALRPSLEEDG